MALPTIHDRVWGYLNGSMNGTQNGTASILKEISMVNGFDSGQTGFSMTDSGRQAETLRKVRLLVVKAIVVLIGQAVSQRTE